MARRVLLGLICTVAALGSGCGTFMNTAYFPHGCGGGEVYCGVRVDWDVAVEHADNTSAWGTALLLADLPLSLVGDTLTLPYTLALALRNDGRADGPASKPVPTGTSDPIQRTDYKAIENRTVIGAPEVKRAAIEPAFWPPY